MKIQRNRRNLYMSIHTRRYLLAVILLLSALGIKAQSDIASLEAMISNHKQIRGLLEYRALAELGLYNYHTKVSKEVKEYKVVNDTLDTYRRCFDIIDLLLKGTATAFHGSATYNRIKANLTGYWKLVDTYNNKILLRGAVWTSDTIILSTSKRTVEQVADEVKEIYKSYQDFLLIMGEKYSPKETRALDLMVCLDKINSSMDKIDESVAAAYLDLWSYMTVRLGFWKKEIFRARTLREIAEDAFGRWVKSQVSAHRCLIEKKSYTPRQPLGGGGLLGERRRKEEAI